MEYIPQLNNIMESLDFRIERMKPPSLRKNSEL